MSHTTIGWGRHSNTGRFIHFGGRVDIVEVDGIPHVLRARDKVYVEAKAMRDMDIGWYRGRRSLGWKSHKAKHQWEHRVILREKQERKCRYPGCVL